MAATGLRAATAVERHMGPYCGSRNRGMWTVVRDAMAMVVACVCSVFSAGGGGGRSVGGWD